MAFITKVDISNNRQIKQYPKTSTQLSGTTIFGVNFEDLESGPDLETAVEIDTITGVTSTFTGDSESTTFYFGNSKLLLGADTIDIITSGTSGTTQFIGPTYTAMTTTTIDDNTVVLEYSGVSYSLSVTDINQIGDTYSGVVNSNITVYSASTLDYTGRTIWNETKGISKTKELIITKNPVVGRIWRCIDIEGKGEWDSNGLTTTATTVTDIRDNAGQIQKKTQLLTFTNGLLTTKDSETDWINITYVPPL